ncbi:MAG: hypothetical protein ACRDQF_14405 [Thermocrispum sp.]
MSYPILREMGEVLRTAPRANASAAEVAAWYERKAVLWEHIAADEASERHAALAQARLAHQHSEALLSGGVAA